MQSCRNAGGVVGVCLAASIVGQALAGGTPENVILIIDPTNATSMYVGNYYARARNIPASNILYLRSYATSYAQFNERSLAGFQGTIDGRGLADHADYAVLSPSDFFYIPAPGLVTDTCSSVFRFSGPSCYTLAFVSSTIQAGGVAVSLGNRYYSSSDTAAAFDSNVTYLNGFSSTSTSARRYYIGAMLGWTGQNGNTIAQVLANIDRGVAVDGTRPDGTFYFMNNTGDTARNVRANQFTAVINAIIARGGKAQKIDGIMPAGKSDCLGIMTGTTSPDFTNVGILPSAFCDHLTSYAATFDVNDQTKLTAWLSHNAVGSAGTVEEPCNYTGKFPNARIHSYYQQGLSLGEAYLRSLQYLPFQQLFVGDPLARPFAYIPVVTVADAPTGEVSGTITLTPTATTSNPNAAIASFELLVDGVLKGATTPGGTFSLNTAALGDGPHDVRVLAYDNTQVKSVGRWTGTITSNNQALVAALAPGGATSGDLATPFTFNAGASGGAVRELRLMQNGRVLAALPAGSASFTVYGQTLGAGTSKVQLVAEFVNRRTATSPPIEITVASSGTPTNMPPIAFSYRKQVLQKVTHVVELPVVTDADPSAVTYTQLSAPAQAQIIGDGPYRLIKPNANASGEETFTFRATVNGVNSGIGTVTLVYSVCPADYDGSGFVDFDDFNQFVEDFIAGAASADFDSSGFVDFDDFNKFVLAFESGC